MTEEIKKAVDYVRENLALADLAILRAKVDKCYEMHIVPNESVMDCDKVVDLLEEYGLVNSLEDRWWEEETDIDQILVEL